ncbi:MAG: SGNH/GDSL hydrolase family protein [Acidimicrobiales bacterium]
MRSVARFVPGIRSVFGQIEPYTEWWCEQNHQAVSSQGRRWVVIGDSMSLGIGASAPHESYVGHLLGELNQREPLGEPWHVINLAMSGAKVADAIERQVPQLRELTEHDHRIDVVTVFIGSNDVIWGLAGTAFREQLRTLIAALPKNTVVIEVYGMSRRAQSCNRLLRRLAEEHGMISVNPWSGDRPEGAKLQGSDRFHPNEHGYRLMSPPILDAIAAASSLVR